MSKNEELPLVSVLMPVYNTEDYVEEAVRSVLNQTYRNIELICFNDASTDRSLEILEALAATDARMTVIDSPINVKQGGGRNRALKASGGRYVMFLDSDDALEPDAVESCVSTIAKDDSIDAVFFDWSLYYPSRDKKIRVEQLGKDAVRLTGDALRRRIIQRSTAVWSAMYDKNLIVENSLFFPEGVFYEDNAVALAIQLKAKNPVKIDKALYLYRQDNQSVMRSTNNMKFFDRIGSAVTLLSNLKRVGVYERFAPLIDYVFIQQYLEHTVYGAIYRFDRVQTDRIKEVREGIDRYIDNYRQNPSYRARPLSKKLKLELHLRFPRVIKTLSNLRHRLSR